MKLLIGLGNPGEKYKNNRHNAGYLFVDFISGYQMPDIRYQKIDTFMNDSGRFVKKITSHYNLEPSNLYIVHDDLDLPLGQYKIQLGVGPKVHYGVNSIENALGTNDFWRIRVGVDSRSPAGQRETGENYVLQDFTKDEMEILKGVYAKIRDDLAKKQD